MEAARALGLPPGARIHRVLLGGRGAEEHLLPHRVRAAPGDAIEFLTVDNRIHTISFLVDSIPLGAVEFLDASGASASPPLVTRGSRFVVRLEGAPLGSYPFVSRGHGGEARGVIELATSPEPTPDPGG